MKALERHINLEVGARVLHCNLHSLQSPSRGWPGQWGLPFGHGFDYSPTHASDDDLRTCLAGAVLVDNSVVGTYLEQGVQPAWGRPSPH